MAFDVGGVTIGVGDFGRLITVGFGAVPPEDVLVGVVVDAGEIGVDLEWLMVCLLINPVDDLNLVCEIAGVLSGHGIDPDQVC